MTVRGAIAPDVLGITLPHEHVAVDFAPAAEQATSGYNREEAFEVALPYLNELRAAGCGTLVDATPAYLGRDPILLRALSEETGLHILTNTGYYGARDDVNVPEHAFTDSIDDLAAIWIGEWENGIGDTGIRPGFIKIGVDSGPLSEMDMALIQAAARTHRASGLTIASHTASATPAFEQLEVLRAEGVHASSWIWVHANAEEDLSAHLEAARQGAWVEFDGVGPNSIDRSVELVMNMRSNRLLSRVLVSQDAGWYSVGEPRGGDFRGYIMMFETFLPALREAGLSDEEIDLLTIDNPADAFRIRIRQYHA
jgi:phosphotriesterase-related protein